MVKVRLGDIMTKKVVKISRSDNSETVEYNLYEKGGLSIPSMDC